MASLSLKQIEIRSIRLVNDDSPVKAVMDVRIGGAVTFHEVGIVDGDQGLRALFPKRMTRFGTKVDLVTFDDEDLLMNWRETMIRAYREESQRTAGQRTRIVHD